MDLEVEEEENRRGFWEMQRWDLRRKEENERWEWMAAAREGKREVVEEEDIERESLEMEKEAAIVVESLRLR